MNRKKKLFNVFYYDLTGHRGVIQIEAYYPIQAGQKFLSTHPNSSLNYIEETKPIF